VLALPWHRYFDIDIAGGRRVLNPLPDALGGDVVSSSDPELGPGVQETVDPREPAVQPVLSALERGQPAAADLARLGYRYVAVLHEVDWRRFEPGLRIDPDLHPLVSSPSLELFAVAPWRGPVIADNTGDPVRAKSVVAPLWSVARSGPAVWGRAASPGWLRGLHKSSSTTGGLVSLPAGGGLVWFWPTCLCLFADILLGAAVVIAARSLLARP
jgi:hypothetical protein